MQMSKKVQTQQMLDMQREIAMKNRQEVIRCEQLEREQEIKQALIKHQKEEEEKRLEQAELLDEKLERSGLYYEETMKQKCERLQKEDLEREEKIKQSMEIVQREEQLNRERVIEKELSASKKYEVYKEDVLIEEEMEKERMKIENEKRAKKAARLTEYQQFQREVKMNEMKRKLELIEDQEAKKQAVIVGLVEAKNKMAAQKLKENYERNFGVNGVKSTRSNSSVGSSVGSKAASRSGSRSGHNADEINVSGSGNLTTSQLIKQKPNQEATKTQNELLEEENTEMRNLQEKERLREAERKQLLANASSDEERAKLLQQFAAERKEAAESMKALNQKHKKQLDGMKL